jgi:hypothetical protein
LVAEYTGVPLPVAVTDEVDEIVVDEMSVAVAETIMAEEE